MNGIAAVRCCRCFPFWPRREAPTNSATEDNQGSRWKRWFPCFRRRNRVGPAPPKAPPPSRVCMGGPLEEPQPMRKSSPHRSSSSSSSGAPCFYSSSSVKRAQQRRGDAETMQDFYHRQLTVVPTTWTLVKFLEDIRETYSSKDPEEAERSRETCRSLLELGSSLPHVRLEAVEDLVPPDIWTLFMREADSPSSSTEDQVLYEDLEEED